ncbi:lysozyme 1-like [Gigantopelta aegis]|uniref:lysozyme 1-like n=1 Tax=Gigantopelta aegis TaxID=1735272 RepID=UPI001B88C04C|nr:lysozyme 1-like [Gigantopelta aegis]
MLFAAIFLCLLPLGMSAISSHCLDCICSLESGCRPLACKWDVNSPSCGYYQLKQVYWIDCGKPGGSLTACALDKSCATRCVKAYMSRYGTHCTRGHTPTCEDYARIHNGGPGGCHRSATLGYWSKIRARGCSKYS